MATFVHLVNMPLLFDHTGHRYGAQRAVAWRVRLAEGGANVANRDRNRFAGRRLDNC